MQPHPALIILLATACMLNAQENADSETKDPFGLDELPEIAEVDRSTADIAAATRGSLVVVTQKGRDGQTNIWKAGRADLHLDGAGWAD